MKIIEAIEPYSFDDFWHGWWRIGWHVSKKPLGFGVTVHYCVRCKRYGCGITLWRWMIAFSCRRNFQHCSQLEALGKAA